MKKSIQIGLIGLVCLFAICGCSSNLSSTSNTVSRDGMIGTWSYARYDSDGEEETLELEITRDSVIIDGERYGYELNGRWIFLKDTDFEIVLYVIDNKNIVGLEGVHLTK